MKLSRAHKVKLNLTPDQEQYFWRCAGVARFTWNWALGWVNMGVPIDVLPKEFNRLRNEEGFAPFVGEVQSYAYQYAFADLNMAIRRYFDFKKRGDLVPPKGFKPRKDGRPYGWPRFKSRSKTTPAFGFANTGMRFDGHTAILQRCPGMVNMSEPLRFDGKIMAGRASYRAGHWYLSVTFDLGEVEIPAHDGPAVGVDVGISNAVITSDGVVYPNLNAIRQNERKLAKLQRSLARMEKGGQNWHKRVKQIARVQKSIADLRKENQHRITHDLTESYSIIGVETLNVKGMMSNGRLAKSVADVGMYEIRRQLEYKAAAKGGVVVPIDQWYPSSKTCNDCGHKLESLPLSVRRWTCPSCGTIHDRDINAAKNIRDEALRTLGA